MYVHLNAYTTFSTCEKPIKSFLKCRKGTPRIGEPHGPASSSLHLIKMICHHNRYIKHLSYSGQKVDLHMCTRTRTRTHAHTHTHTHTYIYIYAHEHTLARVSACSAVIGHKDSESYQNDSPWRQVSQASQLLSVGGLRIYGIIKSKSGHQIFQSRSESSVSCFRAFLDANL
jgi:hypothetical protein